MVRRVSSFPVGAVGLLLVACLLALRGGAAWLVPPGGSPDTPSYLELSTALRTFDFAGFNGERTLGYPLLLAAWGGNTKGVEVFQVLGLSVATAFLAAALARRILGPRWAWVVLSLGLLDAYALYFATQILTESLSAFLTTLTAWCWVEALEFGAPHRRWVPRVALGATMGAGALVRPLFLVYLPLATLALILHDFVRGPGSSSTGTSPKRWLPSFVPLVAALSWVVPACVFNGKTTGTYSLTTLTGYSLTQHAGGFMELSPPQDEPLRSIYLKYREEKRSTGGTHSMTIWAARDEMKKVTGMGHGELSRALSSLSLRLFVAHPGRYAVSVARSFLDFFSAPNARAAGTLPLPGLLWTVEEGLLIGAKVAAGFGALLALARWSRHGRKGLDAEGVLGILFLGAALGQALVEYGESDRYAIPLQPIAWVLATVVVAKGAEGFRGQNGRMGELNFEGG